MISYPVTPDAARALADSASEAIRALNHATLPADGFPGLRYPADAYYLLGSLHQLVIRMPQLLEQVSAFLQRQLQFDVVTVDGGEFAGDPLAAVGTASHDLEGCAPQAARLLASAIEAARQAIAFARYADPDPGKR
jgi:hypothetical protein